MGEGLSSYKPKREASEKNSLARTLILLFQPPKCEKINLCCLAQNTQSVVFCYRSPRRPLQTWSVQLRGTAASALSSSSTPTRQAEFRIAITATPTPTPTSGSAAGPPIPTLRSPAQIVHSLNSSLIFLHQIDFSLFHILSHRFLHLHCGLYLILSYTVISYYSYYIIMFTRSYL